MSTKFNDSCNSKNKSFHDSEFIGGPDDKREDWRYPSKDRPYYIYVEGQKLYVPESIYDATVRDDWRIKKEYELRTKCIVTTENGNTAVCRKSCADCPFYSSRRMNHISIDYMADVYGIDVSYEAQNYVGGESPIEYASRIEREEAVDREVSKFNDPIDRDIIKFLKGEMTLTDISKKHHLTMSSLFRRKEKVIKELQVLLKDYR